ncbi:MAG TPA: glycosyltransferase family 4 protein [Chloroflexota bacterium]
MKICVASIHPRLLSGQIEGVVALAKSLERLGHEVKLVSVFGDELTNARPERPDEGSGQGLAPRLLQIGAVLKKIVAEARCSDVLQLNLPTPAFAGVADVLRELAHRPTVVGFEAHLANVPGALRRVPMAPEFYLPRVLVNNGIVARLAPRRAERYIVSSEWQRTELERLGFASERISVIPNLVIEDKLKPWAKDEARADLGLPDGPLIGYIGHYHDVKGHDVLIEALRIMRANLPAGSSAPRLVMAWSGIGSPQRVQAQLARAGLRDAVIQLPKVNVGQFFSALDVLALPYRFTLGQAAFPGTVLEAMAVGVPLVTSRLPLLEEIVEHEGTGLLAEPGDAASLAGQISRLLADRGLAEQVGAQAKSVYRERFDPQRVAQEYVAAYEEVLAREARLLQPA